MDLFLPDKTTKRYFRNPTGLNPKSLTEEELSETKGMSAIQTKLRHEILDVHGKKMRNALDEEFLKHDKTLHKLAEDLPGYWDGSAAQQLLKEDVSHNRHNMVKPRFLRLERTEYQEFDLDKFRPHIYQETRSLKETPYWTYRKAKKERKKRKKLGLPILEDDEFDDPVLRL